MVTVITNAHLQSTNFGNLKKYTVDNGNGYSFSCINYGASLTQLTMPDKDGKVGNIILQFDDPDTLCADKTYFFNRAIGRVGGRIKNGSFSIDGTMYHVPQNEGKNTLHGGTNGFDGLLWESKTVAKGIEFSRIIKSTDDGFPGDLKVTITYKWKDDQQLVILFKAYNDSDQPSLFNPTIHSYFNLNENPSKGLIHNELRISANEIAETDSQLLPTGKFLPVSGTLFDFQVYKPLDVMLKKLKKSGNNGYDTPFKVERPLIATLKNSVNGRRLDIYSEKNGLIVYTLNSVNTPEKVNNGYRLQPFMAVALEPQTLPDAINNPHFGTIVINAHQEISSEIVYKLSVEA
ncbi:galactose mutarotase [Sporolactobacillus shoreicorticis]|uniref:Aldose 1-epimerase n=1 Tax=Sporolactobacillus shoreicorticis TaxID=1923877 RepID=A0ABW5S1X7_9BACL|nr:aldose epimerase family protein [Sporolactobacillus shoreicorticis]MCO7124481.1 galactose mutarotase [Sporolactobacillus shoreicorticis]